jgi:uroporphyrinogen-III synthase
MKKVLVLRPEPGASATASQALKLGLDAIAVPLFEIEPIEWRLPDQGGLDGLLLTSANAIRFGGAAMGALRGLEVYAVGDATADAARGAGFTVAATGDSGVDGLLKSIDPKLRLLHPCGADRREPHGQTPEITPLIVYRSREIDAPDLAGIDGSIALIHSPRAGRRFADLVDSRDSIAIAAISDAAAEAAGTGWKSVNVAERPNDDALLALAARLCNKPDPE